MARFRCACALLQCEMLSFQSISRKMTSRLLLLFVVILSCIQPLASQEIPQTAKELYKSFDPKQGSLDIKTIREWDEGGVHVKFVTFNVGTFKGQNGKIHNPRLAGYYAYPPSSKKLPAILQIHGGGGVGKPGQAIYWAQQGYACISISWSTGKLNHEKEGAPNTDWDGLAAAHGRNLPNYDNLKFREATTPRDHTISSVPNPMNSSYYLITCAARRSLTFLENQPEVDPNRLGVSGHSMGGKTTVYTSVDPHNDQQRIGERCCGN